MKPPGMSQLAEGAFFVKKYFLRVNMAGGVLFDEKYYFQGTFHGRGYPLEKGAKKGSKS